MRAEMKKRIALLLLCLFAMCSLEAKPEFLLGASFYADRNYISDSQKVNFSRYYTSGYTKLKDIKAVGPQVEMIFFPTTAFRLGLRAASEMVFSIGYDTASSTNQTYNSRNHDFRVDFDVGLAYHQPLSGFGLFLDLSYRFSYFRIATSNNKNTKNEEVEFNRFSASGFGGDVGVYLQSKKSYFKFGFNYTYYLFTEDDDKPYSMALFWGGGMRL